MRALVWLKRDLRLSDHAPLYNAARADAAAALYVIEPEWLSSAEFDPQHLAFALACLEPLRVQLAARGLPLWVRQGEVTEVLTALHVRYRFTHLFSHEETGPGWSYARDRAVRAWCRAHGVVWTEWPQTGVVRGLRDRSGWSDLWQARMEADLVPTPARWRGIEPPRLEPLPTLAELGVPPSRPLPPAGEAAAQALLEGFLAERVRGYRRAISSPLTAADGCSRLSPHLAFGTISMRQVYQATAAAIRATTDRALAGDLRAFASRLRWHCHFMQKLEDEPEIEFRNFSRAYDGLREEAFDPERFAAWCEGRTGFPMVDACMRQLRATGWLNFRMRAMLVSFAAYHLWLHWRLPGQFLARQFLDFEPGIHWSQMQMQSGTTGINALRIYSPAKQARDHDPEGHYIRRWIPEYGTRAYPKPIVDERAALAFARAQLYRVRNSPLARAEAERVQARHGSRKSGLPPTDRKWRPQREKGTHQLELI
ncbi:deoxyribodipyrimidine photolyase [Limisphaera ngatamarikiensis]|uniref:Deoxyribodipyrimidine photolyase n=1 Tax=Limisphaera ngatamarikiensis TaxID=1324935 RepID=A0A6M1RJA3_9BACT|nr:FAD-binding domain-containing protein [Limisphaera ngatamarikiensis]NGO40148.1 deoxyribodipyrimidine photolyase [Limisphaera ngatamarikiensis]